MNLNHVEVAYCKCPADNMATKNKTTSANKELSKLYKNALDITFAT